jgi:hypothetical protein
MNTKTTIRRQSQHPRADVNQAHLAAELKQLLILPQGPQVEELRSRSLVRQSRSHFKTRPVPVGVIHRAGSSLLMVGASLHWTTTGTPGFIE